MTGISTMVVPLFNQIHGIFVSSMVFTLAYIPYDDTKEKIIMNL